MIVMAKFLPVAALAVVVSSGLSAFFGYQNGKTSGENEVQLKWNKEKIETDKKIIELQEKYREQEKLTNEAVAHVADTLHSEMQRRSDEYQRTIDDINSGALVLRERFRGCQSELSSSATPAESGDGEIGSGLSKADERNFVRIARNCDAEVLKLQGCQAYVRSVPCIAWPDVQH